MNIGTRYSALVLLAMWAMPAYGQDAFASEQTFSGYISTEVTFTSAVSDERAQRSELQQMFDKAVSSASNRPKLELSAQIDSYGPAVDVMRFEDVYPPRSRVTNKFSLIVSVDAGRGETLRNISREIDTFIQSTEPPITATVQNGEEFYLTACGEAVPLHSGFVN